VTAAADTYESLIQFLYRAPIGLIQTTLAGAVELINPMAANLLMPLSKDGTLDNLFTALHDVAPQLRESTSAIAQRSGIVCESLRLSLTTVSDSGSAPQFLSLSLLKLNDMQLMGVIIDATLEVQRERATLFQQLGAAAHIDRLTRMPNRLVVLEQLKLAMARRPEESGYLFALLYMNCDRLKLINDSLGYAVGDEVLSLMADRLRFALRARTRGGNTAAGAPMAARLGADEFVVILDDVQRPDDATVVAQRLIDRLAEPYTVGSRQVYCSVSMGIVLRDSAAAVDADELLQDGSLAMDDAKSAGGGRYVLFDRRMSLRAKQRGALEADLHRALKENQLFVVYMPVVGLQGGPVDRSAGVEALVRWRHPTRGVVQPAEFIGVAENCGIIGALDEFVLKTACRQFMRWRAQLGPGAPRKIAVNLSRAQLGVPGLVATVDAILRETAMPPAQLQLEVTESLAAQGSVVQARLHELKALGLSLGLDDFGTGYSSLSSLHLLPVDTLKIDQSFVGQADRNLQQRALIDATIRVAHSLGMTTVAEGIETEAQATVVRQLGSDYGQGYLYSKPLLPDDLLRWLRPDGM
jgi:diguanylate cyclase (GGDEF)-like protein